jgi:hypothetical protein
VHTHGINSIKQRQLENTEELLEISLIYQDSMKANAKQSYGAMNSTGVSNDIIGTGWHITFPYRLSREDPVERCSSEMTSVS